MSIANKYISKIELGDNIYIIKDAEARKAIDTLTKAVIYMGVVDTTKPDNKLRDGSTKTSVILKDGKILTVSSQEGIGYMVVQDKLEFIWNGLQWNELGSTGSLGGFAYVDEGEVTVPTITRGTRSAVSVSGKISVSGATNKQDAPVKGTVNITGTNATEAVAGENIFRYTPRTTIKTGGNATIGTAGATKTTTVATDITGSGGSFVDDYFAEDERLKLTFTAPSYKATTGSITYKTGDPTIAYTAPTLENLGTDFAVTLNSDVKAAVDAQTIASSGTNTLSSTKQYLEDVTIGSTKATVTPKTPTPTV